MGDKTGIAWTDATWNAVVGCTHASRGCDFCYARTLHDRRFLAWKRGKFPDAPAQYQKPFKEVQLLPERLKIPLHWKRPRRVFVNSVSDLFHEDVPFVFVAEVFGVMAEAPQHIFQVLTKRPQRMLEFARWYNDQVLDGRAAADAPILVDAFRKRFPHVWLGTSIEDQTTADLRLPILVKVPAAVRFVSYEPALAAVDFNPWLEPNLPDFPWRDGRDPDVAYREWHPDRGWQIREYAAIAGAFYSRLWHPPLHWIICGGESGPKHRPFDLDWARQARDQCVAAGVPYFFKQVGGLTPKSGGDLLDGQIWHQFPEASR